MHTRLCRQDSYIVPLGWIIRRSRVPQFHCEMLMLRLLANNRGKGGECWQVFYPKTEAVLREDEKGNSSGQDTCQLREVSIGNLWYHIFSLLFKDWSEVQATVTGHRLSWMLKSTVEETRGTLVNGYLVEMTSFRGHTVKCTTQLKYRTYWCVCVTITMRDLGTRYVSATVRRF